MADRAIAVPRGTIAVTPNSESDAQARQFAGQHESIAIGEGGQLNDKPRYAQGVCGLQKIGKRRGRQQHHGQGDHCQGLRANQGAELKAVQRRLDV